MTSKSSVKSTISDSTSAKTEAGTSQPDQPKAIPIGGMTETTWSGVQMWACPRCRSTTFEKTEAATHSCKTARFADQQE